MLRWIEGFEGFGSSGAAPQPTDVIARKYQEVGAESSMYIDDGRYSGQCVRLTSDSCYIHSPSHTLSGWVTIAGFAVKFSALMAAKFFSKYSSGVEGINLRLKTDGEIEVYRAGALLGTTSGAGITAGGWHYVEIRTYCHNSSGTIDVQVDGSNYLSLSGIDTRINTVLYNAFRLVGPSSGYVQFDDLYYLDDSGSKNNSMLGVQQVITLYPNAAGDDDDFTPSSGNNYECVDEVTIDDATSYVQSGVSGEQDLYGFPDIDEADLPDSIAGVQINTEVARVGSTDFNVMQLAKGTSQSAGSASAVDHSDFQTKTRLMENDADGADWTRSNLNATQFGVKVE